MDASGLLEYIEKNKDHLSPLLILTHDYPDPDALASAFALFHLTGTGFGIRGTIAYGGIIGRRENQEMVRLLRIPVYKVRLSHLKKFQNIALVDTQPGFDNNPFPKSKRATIVIDQHPAPSQPDADFSLIDTEAGATSALMARALLARQIEIPTRLATALVYGILSDTLNFHRITKPDTIETYLQMLHLADVRILARIQNPSRPREFFADLVGGINKAVIIRNLVVSHLGNVENPEFVSQMADFLLTCAGIQWAFCTGRHGDNIHLSLRTSVPDASAHEILREVVGHPKHAGGHGQIAGGKVRVGRVGGPEIWDGTEKSLTKRLIQLLKIAAREQFSPLVVPRESTTLLTTEPSA